MKQKQAYSVLVAEDEPLIRENLVKKIRESCPGFEVAGEASDGREALEALAELSPDVLVTDIRMPVMDGIALALAAARDRPELTILLMTGYADQRERAHGLDALIHDVITKPFSLSDLREQTKGVECRKDPGVLDEIPGAYKPIDEVMANQQDLVEIVATLKQVVCVKG